MYLAGEQGGAIMQGELMVGLQRQRRFQGFRCVQALKFEVCAMTQQIHVSDAYGYAGNPAARVENLNFVWPYVGGGRRILGVRQFRRGQAQAVALPRARVCLAGERIDFTKKAVDEGRGDRKSVV